MPTSGATPVTEKEVADFYDAFSHRLVRDYVYGNRRSKAAIKRVVSAITPQTRTVLDVGCGIGVSTAEYHTAAPWIRATGVDISPANICAAQKLFPSPHLTFDVSALQEPPLGGPFDVIALIDVYEHFPRDSWKLYNAILSQLLSEEGVIVITTPSPLHQEYLRRNNPDGLQVIDETVELRDIENLARETGATVTTFDWVTIWNTNDYVHAVLARQPKYGPPRIAPMNARSRTPTVFQRLLSRLRSSRARKAQQARRRLVQQKLNIFVD